MLAEGQVRQGTEHEQADDVEGDGQENVDSVKG